MSSLKVVAPLLLLTMQAALAGQAPTREEQIRDTPITVLKIDPLNSSALNHLLAESGADRATTFEFQKRITEASERSLGPAVFKRHTGQFGEFFEGRLFVHQLCTLAAGLREAGQLEECCEVFERVLRLDAGDMFNTRWSLIALYLERGLPAPASAILTRYAADGRHPARSQWLRVLERYLAGQHEDAIRALGDALGLNRYVANLLLFEDCESFARASKKQQTLLAAAEGIVQLIERCWQAHPRALLWLQTTLHPQQVS